MSESEYGAKSIRDLLHIVFKRKKAILGVFIIAIAASGSIAFLKRPSYMASVNVLVKLGRENVVQSARGDRSPFVFAEQRDFIASEREIIKSRSLIEKVANDIGPEILYPDLSDENRGSMLESMRAALSGLVDHLADLFSGDRTKEESVENSSKLNAALMRIQKTLWVEDPKKSNLISISFRHPDPNMAARFLNGLAKAYIDRHLEIHQVKKSFTFFKEQTEDLKNKMKETENKLKKLREDNHITSFGEQKTLLLRRESEILDASNQMHRMQVELESKMSELRRQIGSTPARIEQGMETGTNPLLMNTLEARLVELELKEKELLTKYTEQSRPVTNVREELKVVKERIAQQVNASVGKSTSGVNPTFQHLQQEFMRNETEYRAVKSKLKTLEQQLEEVQKELAATNKIEEEHDKLQEKFSIDRDNYRTYLAKLEESRISDAMDVEKISNVSIIDPAYPPLKPSGISRKLILLIGAVLGSFGGVTMAFLLEYFTESIETPQEVERLLRVPVLTSIPDLSGRSGVRVF